MVSAETYAIQLAESRGLLDPVRVPAVRARLDGDGGGTLGEALAAAGLIAPGALLRLLAEEFAMPVVDPATAVPEPEALAAVPADLALRCGVLPLSRKGGVLRVAVADPLDDSLDRFGQEVPLLLEPALAPAAALAEALRRHFGIADPVARLAVEIVGVAGAASPGPVEAGDPADAPVVRLVDGILAGAVHRRASDIHLEPLAGRLRVRNRIDGVLHEVESLPLRVHLPLVSRVKLMAGMSIAEKRLPQDGRIRLSTGGAPLDLRASCLPTARGESLVLRILDGANVRIGLGDLGLGKANREAVERLCALPDGLVLATGPTGSGKTTTLYACLQGLNRPDRKIVTVEDPVEYQIPGISQVPVCEETGLTFGAALRALLRQSPNVILVGEIRDRETAETAVAAALTGHLVLSTLHTNDAPGAVARLVDLGVAPYLIAAALRGVIAQRLVRRVCPSCACTPAAPGRDGGRGAGLGIAPGPERGSGCPECSGTGFRGRVGIFEIFLVNEAVQRLIYDNVTALKLRQHARENGMRTLRDDGIDKVQDGLTPFAEVAAATNSDSD